MEAVRSLAQYPRECFYCVFTERVLKNNPIFSLTATTPLLILCLEPKKIWIFSTQHAGILFLNPATHGGEAWDPGSVYGAQWNVDAEVEVQEKRN